MPNMDGFTASEYIRNSMKIKTPIIALSADVMDGVAEKAIQSGMDDYIAKPIDKTILYKTILHHFYPDSDLEFTVPESTPDVRQYAMTEALPSIDVKSGLATSSNNIELYEVILQKFAYKWRNVSPN